MQQSPRENSGGRNGAPPGLGRIDAMEYHPMAESMEVAHANGAEVTIRVGSRLISGWAFPIPSLRPGDTVTVVVEPAAAGDRPPDRRVVARLTGSVDDGRNGDADEEDAAVIVPALINGWRLLPEFGIWVVQARPEVPSRLGDPRVQPGLAVTDPDDGWTLGIVLDLEHAWVPGTLSADLIFIGPEPDPGLDERQRESWQEDVRPARGRPLIEATP